MQWRIEHFQSLPSTQDLLKQRADEGVSEGLLLRADHQSHGRGRHDRRWEGGHGNLLFSFLLRPRVAAKDAAGLGLILGLAVARTLESFLPPDSPPRIKWPNDVFVQGRKIAGILLETGLKGPDVDWVAAGVGINVAHAPLPQSLCLGDCVQSLPDLTSLLEAFLNEFEPLYRLWQTQGFAPIQPAWSRQALLQGTQITIKNGNALVTGDFYGIDEQGAIQIMSPEGRLITLTAGDVFATLPREA